MNPENAIREESARRLAETRYEGDSGTAQIFRIVAASESKERPDEFEKIGRREPTLPEGRTVGEPFPREEVNAVIDPSFYEAGEFDPR